MNTIILSGTFVIESIKSALEFWNQKFPYPFILAFAPYNQLFQHLADYTRQLSVNSKDINVLLIRNSDIRKDNANLKLLIDAIKSAAEITQSKFIVCLCPDADSKDMAWEEEIISYLAKVDNISLILSQEITLICGPEIFDPLTEKIAHIPYTSKFYTALATLIARKIFTSSHLAYKVIVADCDHTLWKGVCGEDDLTNIEISPPFQILQSFLLQQHNSGILLCLASKNVEEDVYHIFKNHPDMILKWEDITRHKINWLPKSQNIKSLSAELNLGIDSFIFIDDNPLECAEVKQNCPEVLTILLPSNEKLTTEFLQNLWFFDRTKVTEEDKMRGEHYKQNSARETFKQQSSGIKTFFSNLELNISISKVQPHEISRLSQLSERTNQFNFTTIRRTETEFITLSQTSNIWVVKVKDRFGDYGFVGAIIFNFEEDFLIIETFLLSCRVLNRGVEHKMLAFLGEIALSHGIQKIKLLYRATKKNQPAYNFLQRYTSKCEVTETEDQHICFEIDSQYALQVVFDPEDLSTPMSLSEDLAPLVHQSNQEGIKPPYLLLAALTELSSLDLIDRAVEINQQQKRALTESYIQPRNGLQKTLVHIWEKSLNIVPIGIQDDFFKIGGDSLRAVQMISEIYNALALPLTFGDFYQAPTIEKLSLLLEQKLGRPQQNTYPPLLPSAQNDHFPASFEQQRLWFMQQILSENGVYNVSLAYLIKGRLELEFLETAVNTLIQRHQVLRTTFEIRSDGEIIQVIKKDMFLPLELVELIEEQDLAQMLRDEASKEFNLELGPLVRSKLLRFDSSKNIFILTMHHTIVDEASLQIIIYELSKLYQNPASLLPLIRHYGDYACWQRSWLHGKTLENQLLYWEKQLADIPELHSLPTFKERPQKPSGRGSVYTHKLPKGLFDSLKLIGFEQGSTLFTTLLAVFQILLHRYTGDHQIVVGTPISHRHHPNVIDMVGLFVNTVVIKGNFEKNLSFLQLLKQLQNTIVEAFENQDAPFDKVVEVLKLPRSSSHHPLMQVMFVLRKDKLELKLPELEIERLDVLLPFVHFDLSLIAEPTANGLTLNFEYNTDIFESEQMRRLALHFEKVASAIVENEHLLIGDFSLLTNEERQRQLIEWNSTSTPYPHRTIHALFEEQAKKHSHCMAIHFEHESWTYEELDSRANHIADGLRQAGVMRGSLVGVFLARSLDLIASLLGVLKAGGAFVPIDPDYPEKYLKFVLADTQASILISHTAFKETLPIFDGNILFIDLITKHYPQETTTSTESSPNDLAYVIYTSGSTGKSKGVMIEHYAVCNLAKAASHSLQINEKSCFLQFASISFDAAILEWLTPLLAGGSVVLASPWDRLDPKKLEQLFINKNISIASFPPTFLSALPEESNFPTLQTLVVGGETISNDLIHKWKSRVHLYNLYGPTETTVFSTYHHYSPECAASCNTIGKPIDNTQMYILDRYLQPVPIGVTGELFIGGAGVARGYLHRSKLTAEKFIPDPFAGACKFQDRLFKTGDLGRYLSDGNIEFLGRCDHQVKFNGHRIELEQIELLLKKHKTIKNAVVELREEVFNQKQLVAYIVLKTSFSTIDKSEDQGDIQQLITQHFPLFMMPNVFVFLEELPLLPNGKVNRKALPAPYKKTGRKKMKLKLNYTELEKKLINLWIELLGTSDINIFDNFFDLGGTSLLCIKMMALMSSRMNCTFNMGDFYSSPTIATLSKGIRIYLQRPSPHLLAIQENGENSPFFLIHPSTGLSSPYLSLKEHLPGKPIYGINNPFHGQSYFSSVQSMATHYIGLLRTLQPYGAYCLGGWSFGGVVAFEMARQLQTLGEEVVNLILIDSYHTIKTSQDKSEIQRIESLLDEQKIGRLSPEWMILKTEMIHNSRLLKAYSPSPYCGNAVIFKTENADFQNDNEGNNDWTQLILKPHVAYQLTGEHSLLFEKQYVHEIADKLKVIFGF